MGNKIPPTDSSQAVGRCLEAGRLRYRLESENSDVGAADDLTNVDLDPIVPC